MRRWSLPLVVALAATAPLGCARSSGSSGSTHSDADLKSLSVEEVAARIALHDGKTVVYDDNSKDRYAKSHVLGAKWLNFHEMTAADLPADKATSLVFYCANRL
jgi:hypothetical protein